MVAVGLWSALAARSAGRDLLWGPVGFAAMLLVGAVLGLQGVALPAVEPMIAASLLVTGLLVVSRLRVPGLVAALGVGVFAVFHGVAHGYRAGRQRQRLVDPGRHAHGYRAAAQRRPGARAGRCATAMCGWPAPPVRAWRHSAARCWRRWPEPSLQGAFMIPGELLHRTR